MGFRFHPSHYLKNQKGFTLFELIIVIAIMGFVLTAGFSFMMFGNRAFQATSKHAEQQFDVRMPLDFISQSVRYAEAVQILAAVPAADANFNDIYIEANQIKYRENGVEKAIPGVSTVTNYEFTARKLGSKTLKITVEKTGSDSFDISTEVAVLNVGSAGITGANQGVCIRFTADPVITGLPPEIVSAQDVAVTIPQNAVFLMPSQVDVTRSDGSTGKASVVWNPNVVDTTTIGVKTCEGTVNGFATDKVTLEVTVEAMAIVSIADINVTVGQGQVYNAPSVVPALMDDGSTYDVAVTWSPAAISTASVGTVTALGTVDGYTPKVNLNVTVTALSIVSIPNLSDSVLQAAPFTLPSTVTANMSDGSTQPFSVTWSPAALSTSTAGIVTAEGTVAGYTPKVTFTLTVSTNTPLEITNIPSKAQKNKTFTYTAQATGGSGGYSYSFTNITGWQTSPSYNSSGVFSATAPKDKNDTAKFTIKVTDSSGTSTTYNVTVTAE